MLRTSWGSLPTSSFCKIVNFFSLCFLAGHIKAWRVTDLEAGIKEGLQVRLELRLQQLVWYHNYLAAEHRTLRAGLHLSSATAPGKFVYWLTRLLFWKVNIVRRYLNESLSVSSPALACFRLNIALLPQLLFLSKLICLMQVQMSIASWTVKLF